MHSLSSPSLQPGFAVVCVGLATRDVIASTSRYPGADERVEADEVVTAGGGPAATAAVVLARQGWPVAFAGVIGDDDVGDEIRAGLEAEGVDVALLRVVPGLTSPTAVIIAARERATRAILTHLPIGGPEVDDQTAAVCRAAAWVHVDHLGAPAVAVARAQGRLGTVPVSFDEGSRTLVDVDGVELYAPSAGGLRQRFPLPTDAALAAALAAGARTVVATCGPDGCRIAGADGTRATVPALAGTAVRSTLGAGDVFHGGLLSGLLQGLPIVEAARFATATAALSCRALDGRSAIPDRPSARAAAAGALASGAGR